MRHLRSDYDSIQPWPTKRLHIEVNIEEDELVFVLRAKDPAAPDTVRFWADRAQALGSELATVERVRGWANDMEIQREERWPDKLFPDTPEEYLR